MFQRSLARPQRKVHPLKHQLKLLSGKTNYIDDWFASIVKSEQFYDDHANSSPRRYFYNVDLQGRLFLEETLPKNIATSIKDNRFLDFFFSRVRPVGPREEEIMLEFHISRNEYPFVSPCGQELNFIRPAATPIVFHTFHKASNTLVFAGSKTQGFRMSDLAMSEQTGRLYHKCDHLEKTTKKMQQFNASDDQYALIRSAVVVALSDRIGSLSGDCFSQQDSAATSKLSGLAYFSEGGECHPIPWLPKELDLGPWALPFSEEAPDG